MKQFIRVVLIIVGTVSIISGIIGVFLPVLPTTPFLLLGAACYIRSSKKLYDWLISNRLLGPYIKNYREGRGIPLKTKIVAILFLWLTISSSIIFISSIIVRIILPLIAIGVTIHILSIKTLSN